MTRVVLENVRGDKDMVAVPLSETEIDMLIGMWEFTDSLDHEALSVQLKALGAKELLRQARRKKKA